MDIKRLVVDVHLAGLDLGQVENFVDQVQQVLCCNLDAVGVRARLLIALVVRILFQHFTVTDDRIQRRSQFVGYIGQEAALGLVRRLGAHLVDLCVMRNLFRLSTTRDLGGESMNQLLSRYG